MKRIRIVKYSGIAAIGLISGLVLHLGARPAAGADNPLPQTTADPTVPVDELELMLRPLTKEELFVEADGWMKLLQDKVAEISAHEISVKRKNREIEDAEQAAKAAEPDETPAPADLPGSTESAQKAEEVEKKTEEKEATVKGIINLREQRQGLIDRFYAVLDELKAKGGEVEAYTTYVTAVTGLQADIDVSDVSVLWTTSQGWLTSKEGGLRWGKNIIYFLLTLLVSWIVARIAANAVRRALAVTRTTSDLLKTFLVSLVRRCMLLAGLLVAITMLEISVGPVLAIVGAAGFVVAFALQGTLSNFASGIMILAYRPFDIGDAINAGGVAGVVQSMNLVSTVIHTFDNQRVIVPNNSIWGGVITNITGLPTRRVDMVFGISYGDDMDKAAGILEDLVKKHELVLGDPAPVIKVHELADSSVNLVCRPWAKTSDYWTVYWDVTKQAKQRFDAEGISIPFPQRDINVYQQSAAT